MHGIVWNAYRAEGFTVPIAVGIPVALRMCTRLATARARRIIQSAALFATSTEVDPHHVRIACVPRAARVGLRLGVECLGDVGGRKKGLDWIRRVLRETHLCEITQ